MQPFADVPQPVAADISIETKPKLVERLQKLASQRGN